MRQKLFTKICFIMLSLGAGFLAQAQTRCLSPEYQQRNATHIYLIKLNEMGHLPASGDEYRAARIDTRGARIEVLKVYRGNIDAVKGVENAMLEIHCNNSSGLDCSVLEEKNYPFYLGQMYMVYDAPNDDGLLKMRITACPSSWHHIQTLDMLNDFERRYDPVWESRNWLIEYEGYDASQVTEDGRIIEVAQEGQTDSAVEESGGNRVEIIDATDMSAPNNNAPIIDLPAPMKP